MLGALPTKIKTCQVSGGPHKIIYFPQVVITKDRPLENVVNQAIVTQTQELIDKQTDNMPTPVEEMIGLYELTPSVYGFPMFPISVYDIQDIIDENGPLGRLIASH